MRSKSKTSGRGGEEVGGSRLSGDDRGGLATDGSREGRRLADVLGGRGLAHLEVRLDVRLPLLRVAVALGDGPFEVAHGRLLVEDGAGRAGAFHTETVRAAEVHLAVLLVAEELSIGALAAVSVVRH